VEQDEGGGENVMASTKRNEMDTLSTLRHIQNQVTVLQGRSGRRTGGSFYITGWI